MKQINNFDFGKHPSKQVGTVVPVSSNRRYWRKFFSSKLSIISLIVLLLISIFLISSLLFYSASSYKTINDAYSLNSELPSSLRPWKTLILPESDELNVFREFAKYNKDSVFIDKIIDDKDGLISYSVTFNAYKIFGDTKLHLLGTNSQGIDIFARLISTLINLIIISVSAAVISVFLSIILGSLTAIYFKKSISQIIEKIFSTFALIPYIFISVIVFLLVKNTVVNAIIIFSVISTITLFISSYQKTCEILENEFINADKSVGFSNFDLLIRTVFKPVFLHQLIQATEQLSLIFLTYTAISIFSIDTSTLTLGTVIKEALDLISINPWYLVTLFVLITGLMFGFKFLAFGLNNSYINFRGSDE
ncbi:hypothetical protein KQ872_03280 [Mycoplasma sp. ES3225-GEN-MYC]|uniref:ABC transporter permease subunit n=1 Tax=Mycoplasma miroungigenitalium TaxID=754515 RepID=UPI001C110E25|nr:ABC transporter permease subunit [Mycoplasma miroungigenitalium]MBU4691970.1 hypothetical protein [Mycoplasma miroungigenitalium]